MKYFSLFLIIYEILPIFDLFFVVFSHIFGFSTKFARFLDKNGVWREKNRWWTTLPNFLPGRGVLREMSGGKAARALFRR
ncbi:MAG TPA: hypothetical protein PLD40_02905 [Kiritimatiellia bacterium]|jgi:hypothetical protein|nr:hypothetical protein [Kiritimatiellia bacterium]HOU58073.1 hypothetical protein [Kiritimatiellia bacterium]HPV46519.1 hypothetical protein [Kiritimatiellia bacterium]HQK43551.1 hypothetical protein [Kiritimatiellia bacterium]HQM22169.1 hypothetical protein [Kiritimatiellia bacterium]